MSVTGITAKLSTQISKVSYRIEMALAFQLAQVLERPKKDKKALGKTKVL